MSNHVFAKLLKKYRENQGLSQSQLAKSSGVKLRTLQWYEGKKDNELSPALKLLLYILKTTK